MGMIIAIFMYQKCTIQTIKKIMIVEDIKRFFCEIFTEFFEKKECKTEENIEL